MDKKYSTLRMKMERFNAWETKELKKVCELNRFQQFLILYDLGQLYDRNVLNQSHDKHLESLIRTSKRLQMASTKARKLFF